MTDLPLLDVEGTALQRPQPLGVLDGPAGMLLLDVDATDLAPLDALRDGRLPDPASHAAAALIDAVVRDDLASARSLLRSSRIDAVNGFVLSSTDELLTAARAAAADHPQLRVVVEAAAYSSGLTDDAPDGTGLDGEFAVLALTTQAAHALEHHDLPSAIGLLERASAVAEGVGPALHGRMLGSLAEHLQQLHGANDTVVDAYDRAIAVLRRTGLDVARAGLQLQRGVVVHELAQGQRHRLVEAIRDYQSALLVLNERDHTESFAFANMNIALAILALPMTQASDQVRLGVAVQSLRAALRVYTPQMHPAEWSGAQLNLANALQYLPSRHREDNLAEAVTLYEAILEVRSPDHDPLGVARVLANQANALAHLGIFDHAVAKYTEARRLFERAGDADGVAVIDQQLQTISSTPRRTA